MNESCLIMHDEKKDIEVFPPSATSYSEIAAPKSNPRTYLDLKRKATTLQPLKNTILQVF